MSLNSWFCTSRILKMDFKVNLNDTKFMKFSHSVPLTALLWWSEENHRPEIEYEISSQWLTDGGGLKFEGSNSFQKEAVRLSLTFLNQYWTIWDGKCRVFYISQCGNFRIYQSLRFYVKSTSGFLEVQNLPFYHI